MMRRRFDNNSGKRGVYEPVLAKFSVERMLAPE